MSSEDELRAPVAVTIATILTLALLVGAAHADGHLSARAAHGALVGLATGTVTLTTAYLAVTHFEVVA